VMDASSEATVDAVAGIGGGVVALLATYPLMTLTTRYQTRRAPMAREELSSSSTTPSAAATTAAIERTTRENGESCGNGNASAATSEGESVMRKEEELSRAAVTAAPVLLERVAEAWRRDSAAAVMRGLESLYAGVGPALVGTICSQGSYYYFYSLLRRLVSGGSERSAVLSTQGTVLVSALAGCINVLLNNPIWVIVTRMQHQGGAARVVPTIRELYRESGVRMLWKGVWPALLMVSNPVVQFVLLEKAAAVAARERAAGGVRPNAWRMLLVGAAAKLIATLLTYPMLVVKSILQVSGPSNMLRALRELWVRHGPLAFYRGVHTKLLQSVLAAALLFLVRARLQAAVRLALRAVRSRIIK